MNRAIILVFILGAMMPNIIVTKEHSFMNFVLQFIDADSEQLLIMPSAHMQENHSEHNDLDAAEFDAGNFREECKEATLEKQVQCFVDFFGSTLTNRNVEKFSELAHSSFNKLFVHQKYLYRYLPEDKLDEKLPEYFKLYSGDASDLSQKVIPEVKACENDYVFHWFDSQSVDVSSDDKFKHYGQFFAADCRDKANIKVIVFSGFRDGLYKEKPISEENDSFIRAHVKDSMLFLINRHFGLSS